MCVAVLPCQAKNHLPNMGACQIPMTLPLPVSESHAVGSFRHRQVPGLYRQRPSSSNNDKPEYGVPIPPK
eukprot:5060672-Amphidinium_carterae.1